MEERRRYPRVNISFPVECKSLPQGNYFYTVSKDLSSGGIKIISDTFLPKDYLMKVYVNLVDTVINLKAKVAWCNKLRASEKYNAGLEFVEASNESQQSISQFLAKVN
ncbi:MAG: PilZ domain-containing protein [Candidatus Omnitrophota bacterium]